MSSSVAVPEGPAPAAAASSTTSTTGPVLVVGTGLLGTSLALALTAAGIAVQLEDTSPTSLALARDMGAGTPRSELEARGLAVGTTVPEPSLVVVATPPDVAAAVVLAAPLVLAPLVRATGTVAGPERAATIAVVQGGTPQLGMGAMDVPMVNLRRISS